MNKSSICKNCRFIDYYMFIPWNKQFYDTADCYHPNKHKDVMDKIVCEDFEPRKINDNNL